MLMRTTQGSRALAARTAALFKLGMIGAVLLASISGGYCYALYMPCRETELDNDRRMEKARVDAERHAAQGQLFAQHQDPEQHQSAQKAAAQIRYQACLSSAGAARDASQAAECKRLGEKDREDYANCLSKLNLPKTYCDAAYTIRDASPNCTLPGEIATVLDGDLANARYRCVRELEAAGQ